ncbi:MAG: TM1802 family CRISPR-associated protein, partial [Elusimicrobiales bacterium]|nr:TM1802 family CRISPR-associated protein [Elusimicrobiales bacterium]
MLSAINELGRLKLSLDKEGLIDIFVENPNLNNKYNKVILIVFEIDKDKVFYKDVELEDFSNEKITRYLYKKGTPNGTDYTPTCKITELKKTYENKIEKWFENFKEYDELIKKISDELNRNKNIIISKIEKLQSEIKHSSILTIAFEQDSKRKYIGDYKVFIDIFKELIEKNYKESLKENEVCALCGEVKEVSGNSLSNIFKFYTIDKPGYISGLNEKLAWRNAPICFDCSKNLEKAK